MSQPQQDLKSHARYVPLFHFVLAGLIGANCLHAVRTFLPFSQDSLYRMIVAVALLLMFFFVRAFPV